MGSQAGIVDINHAFHLYYKCRGAWRKALSDLWLIARFSFQISLYSVVND